MLLILLLLANLLSSRAEGGEIRWASEVSPHSGPCMASVLSYNDKEGRKSCGRFLVRDIFMLTVAHCNRRRISVTLGAHNIRKMENRQQLQNKAQLIWAMKTISLLWSQDRVRPEQVCSMAGWGRLASGKKATTLQEVDPEVQNEQKCKDLFKNYSNFIQLCVGNPKDMKATASRNSGVPLVCNNVAQGIVSFEKTMVNLHVSSPGSRACCPG